MVLKSYIYHRIIVSTKRKKYNVRREDNLMIKKRIFSGVLLFLLICSFCFQPSAAAGETLTNRFNVVVVLDASGSMTSTDPSGYRYEAINQFASLLAEKGNVVGGIVFSTGINAQISPFPINSQADKDKVTDLLRSVTPNRGWTNIGEALDLAVTELIDKGNPELPSVILFLSDGNTELSSDKAIEESIAKKDAAIQRAWEKNIPIYSVCLNENNSADTSEMLQISASTGGVFQEVNSAEDLREAFNNFYNLIYGTSTITLVDETFPETGVVETLFDIPGIGVEEVNIIIYGKTSEIKLYKPDGSESNLMSNSSNTFTMVKITDIVPGTWNLVTKGIPGDQIKINMVYNAALNLELKIDDEDNLLDTNTNLQITALLKSGDVIASSEDQLMGYSATLQILDAYGDPIGNAPMIPNGNAFALSRQFQEGVYHFKATVTGNYLNRESEIIGPITVVKAAVPEPNTVDEEPTVTTPQPPVPPSNTPPTPFEAVVEKSVYIFPFSTPSFLFDMNSLASDLEDEDLRYKVESSSFIDGTDYSIDNEVLELYHFSISKGAFKIRATDSGGLSCKIELIVTSHNVGLMALIGMGLIGLVVLTVFLILLYIALNKPFYGTIQAHSYINGSAKGKERSPRRGRCKLTLFGMDNIGIDYTKAYFQATGKNYIELNTKQKVLWNGKETNKVRIQSGTEVIISTTQQPSKQMYIRFVSRTRNAARGVRNRPQARR